MVVSSTLFLPPTICSNLVQAEHMYLVNLLNGGVNFSLPHTSLQNGQRNVWTKGSSPSMKPWHNVKVNRISFFTLPSYPPSPHRIKLKAPWPSFHTHIKRTKLH